MQDAAGDLDMQLEVLYGERDDNEVILRNARQVLASPQRPDYLIFVNEMYLGPEILRMFADSGIRLFAVHSSLTANSNSWPAVPGTSTPTGSAAWSPTTRKPVT